MKLLMKTDYKIDIRLFDRIYKYYLSGGFLLFLFSIPILTSSITLGPYFVYVVSLSGIYVILVLGINLLMGNTGQISLGHSALLSIGAYSAAILYMKAGLPFILVLVLAGLITSLAGMIVGVTALRLKELYLAIATMAFAFIIEEVIVRCESITHGSYGYLVSRPKIIASDWRMYYVIVILAILFVLITKNIMRSPLGRAFVSIRDSEISAKTLGINTARYKIISFGISSFYAGVAGGLYAFFLTFIGPDNFGIGESILYLVMVIIGGLGSIPGSIIGAIFITVLPETIRVAKNYLPFFIRSLTGIDAIFYGTILLLFIIYEPAGIYGRWLKIKYHAQMFPFYRKATFKRVRKFYRKEIV